MKKIILVMSLAAIIFVLIACSGGKNTGQTEPTKPPPGIRVETLPTGTQEPGVAAGLADVQTPTVQPSPTWLYYDPTPDENMLADQIQSIMDDIESRLQKEQQKFKP